MSKQEQHPLVSIISVNYNQSAVTLEMLESLKTLSYPNFEVLIVDNGSPNDNPGIIKERFPQVKLILSKRNLGFAGGNNIGVEKAKGKYILFLNNDTVATPNMLEPMVGIFEQNPHAGMASPKILFWNSPGKKAIQYAGSTGINPYTVRSQKIDTPPIDQGQFDYIKETNLCHGAAMMVPASVIHKAGLMSDLYFLYYEEHDWCERIKQAGYKVYYAGTSSVYHKESMSVGKNTPLKTYYMTRGRLIYTRRNLKNIQLIISLLFFIFFAFPKNATKYLIKREFRHLRAFLNACSWNLKNRNLLRNPRLTVDKQGNKTLINQTYQELIKF